MDEYSLFTTGGLFDDYNLYNSGSTLLDAYSSVPEPSILDTLVSGAGDFFSNNAGTLLTGGTIAALQGLSQQNAIKAQGKNTLEQLRVKNEFDQQLQEKVIAAQMEQLRSQEKLAREAMLQQAFKNIVQTTLAGGQTKANALTSLAAAGQNAALR